MSIDYTSSTPIIEQLCASRDRAFDRLDRYAALVGKLSALVEIATIDLDCNDGVRAREALVQAKALIKEPR